MSKKFFLYNLLLFWTAISFQSKAQEGTEISSSSNSATATIVLGVSEVSLIKTSSDVINLQLNQQDAGMSVQTSVSDSTARMLISSVISTSQMRTLSAKITAGTVPTGTHLSLSALQPNANFAGGPGVFASATELDATDKPIISDIATCFSGTGPTDGYMLKFNYSLDLNPATYGALRATMGTQIVVTFTLTAAL